MRAPRSIVALAVLCLVQLALVVAVTNPAHPVRPILPVELAGFAVLAGTLGVLSWSYRGTSPLGRRSLLVLLFGGALLMQLASLLSRPVSSDDDYRYAWDAKVQLAGIDPYRYAPVDPALTELRDGFLFPAEVPCGLHPIPGGCTNINRPAAHTIYPPVAQAAFDVIRLVSLGGRGNHLPMQIAGGLGMLVSTALLLRWRAHIGEPLWPVAAWALNPVVALELTNNAHIEWLVCVLALSSLLATRAGRPAWSGVLIGAATATKLYPGVLIVNAGRRPVRMVSTALAVVLLSYLPHVLAVRTKVIGYLPSYLREEDYSGGGRYIVVGWFTSGKIADLIGPLSLMIGLIWLWRRADPKRPDVTAVAVAGLYLLITTPNYSWYAMLLVAMVAASGRLEWLWLSFSPTLLYLSNTTHLGPHRAAALGYGVALLVVLVASRHRAHSGATGRGRRRRPAGDDGPDFLESATTDNKTPVDV